MYYNAIISQGALILEYTFWLNIQMIAWLILAEIFYFYRLACASLDIYAFWTVEEGESPWAFVTYQFY